MLNAVAMFAASDRDVSPYGPDIERVIDMLAEIGIVARETRFGMTAEFPLADTPAGAVDGGGMCGFQMEAMTPHVLIGSGALVTLKLPESWAGEDAASTAAKLNRAEADEFVRSPLLGGWGIAPDDGSVTYSAFLPTQLDARGLLEYVVMSVAVRTRWLGEFLRRD